MNRPVGLIRESHEATPGALEHDGAMVMCPLVPLELAAERACGCRKLSFPANQLIRRRRSGFWHSRPLGCGRLMR